MTVHSAEGKAATDIIQANIDRYKLLADDRNRSEEAGNGNTLRMPTRKFSLIGGLPLPVGHAFVADE